MSFIINSYLFAEAGGGVSPPSTDLVVWLKADAGTYSDDNPGTTPQASDGGNVKTWRDQSGNNHHAFNTNGTTSFHPTLRTNVINGFPVLRFAAANSQSLGITDHADIELDTNSTIMIVMKLATVTGSFQAILSKDNGGSAGAYMYHIAATSGKPNLDRPFIEAGNPATTAPGTTNFRVLTCHVSGTTVSHFLDGSANGTDTLAVGNATNTVLRLANFNNGFIIGMDVAEILIYKAALSTGDREAAEDYLGTRYALTITH